ncbi:MAG: SurA N-terminal domain-containing protein [Acidobacteriota bacterium]|nr:SurA N-terminal domain-containing protein [Blastocatellia bacterium]MDW8237988.1 SurA N-terminal domain-containing protein [Acidobacteriota bacterium]
MSHKRRVKLADRCSVSSALGMFFGFMNVVFPFAIGMSMIICMMLVGHASTGQDGTHQSAMRHPPSVILVDRLVALVNGEPITESDLLWLMALDPQQPEGTFTNRAKRLRLEQAIDQQLLYQEAQKLPAIDVRPEDISRFIAELVRQFPSESVFRRRLEAVGLDGPALQQRVRQQLIILQFIEFRFRSFVLVSDAEIQTYYQSRVARLLQERGETPPPLDEKLRSVIEQTIVEDKVQSDLNDWFEEARLRAEIVRLVEY